MKKLYALIALIAGVSCVSAQEPKPSDRSIHTHPTKFATDAYIHLKPTENQRNLHLASAFNGWLYAAYTVNDTIAHKGGITVRYSRDGGLTWNHFVNYQYNNSYYPLTGIVVTGADTNNLGVYVAGVLQTVSNGSYSIYIDKFDGRNGNLVAGQIFVRSLGNYAVYDLSLANDYPFPSSTASPYSIGLLYSRQGAGMDSVLFALSTDGGISFATRRTVAVTNGAFHKVSLAYGRSASISGGVYFAAWEKFAGSNSVMGHIYTSHTGPTICSPWLNPVCLDTLSAATNNFVRDPVISCQYGVLDNDSSSLTSTVIFAKARNGNLNDNDVSGYVNSKAPVGFTWRRFDVAATAENDLQASIIFDPLSNNFQLTYFDSTNGRLAYMYNDYNMMSPSSWIINNVQYNDLSTNLREPYPQVVINPLIQQPCFAWISEDSNQNGAALFDAVYNGMLTTGVNSVSVSSEPEGVYPNPATDQVVLRINQADISGEVRLAVYDIIGNQVVSNIVEPGMGVKLKFEVGSIPDGVYFCRLEGGQETKSYRFVVKH